jgi:hypothetical protein
VDIWSLEDTGVIQAHDIGTLGVRHALVGTVDVVDRLAIATLPDLSEHASVRATGIDRLQAGDIGGKLELSGVLGGGSIGSILPTGSLEMAGVETDLEINGDIENDVTVTADLTGGIWQLGILTATTGTLHVRGSVSGHIVLHRLSDLIGDLGGGHIIVDGSVLAGAQVNASTNGLDKEFIVARFGGWLSGETGCAIDQNAYVALDYQCTTGTCLDCPDLQVRGVTYCKGDMNNWGWTDFNDVNWFVAALANPSAFSIAHPGLGGTADNYVAGGLLYHGDCNCDGAFNYDDINALIARLGTCSSDCQQNLDDVPPYDPAGLAQQLRSHIDAENLPALRAIAAAEAQHAPRSAVRHFWHLVHQHLAD